MAQRGPLLAGLVTLAALLLGLALSLALLVGDPIEPEVLRMIVSERCPRFERAEEQLFEVLRVVLPLQPTCRTPVPVRGLPGLLEILGHMVKDGRVLIGQPDVEVATRRLRGGRRWGSPGHAAETLATAYNSSQAAGYRAPPVTNA